MKSHIFASVVIFLLLVGLSLSTINSKNLTDFSLHHMVTEAIVERRTVKLGGSLSPYLQPNGDVVTYQGSVYAVKQPGTSFLGALAYFPLAKLGVHYGTDYLVTSAWVSVWTSSVIVGFLGVAIFWLCLRLHIPSRSAIAIALGSLVCTTILPYTGFPHHDTLALLPLYGAIYLSFQGMTKSAAETKHDYFLVAGFLAGLTLFFSILPITLILALVLCIAYKKRYLATIQFAVGGAVGMLPTLIYNYFVLGGFLHFPNLMGASVDTIPHLSLMEMGPNLLRYITQPGLSVLLFAPLAVLGLSGWIFSKNKNKEWRILRNFVLLATVLFAIHLSSFATEGDLQYGPRYLLPLLPLWSIGLATLLPHTMMRRIIWILAGLSFGLNLLGALYGAMYKEMTVFPAGQYLGYLFSPKLLVYPLQIWGIGILVLTVGMIGVTWRKTV